MEEEARRLEEEERVKEAAAKRVAAAAAAAEKEKQQRLATMAVFARAEALEREEQESAKRMRPLVPIDYSQEEQVAVTVPKQGAAAASELLKRLNARLASSRTGKPPSEMSDAEVIAASNTVDWAKSSASTTVERTSSWVQAELMTLMGGDAEVASEIADFVMDKLSKRTTGSVLLSDVREFLDDDAECFVAKVYRRLLQL